MNHTIAEGFSCVIVVRLNLNRILYVCHDLLPPDQAQQALQECQAGADTGGGVRPGRALGGNEGERIPFGMLLSCPLRQRKVGRVFRAEGHEGFSLERASILRFPQSKGVGAYPY
jgi:hypothetical protein